MCHLSQNSSFIGSDFEAMKKEIKTEEFKKISLDVLIAVHNFCEHNEIRYSLACGTLIGAIRHKGYIPWDDDIDIYMVREDYNRFISIFPQSYLQKYSLIALENSKEWNCAFAKVYDERTIMIEDKRTDIKNLGIGIDIFPIDFAPDDAEEWNHYERNRKVLRGLYEMKELRWRSTRSFFKNILVEICSLPLLPFSSRFWAERMNSYAQKYNGTESDYYAENCYGLPNNRFPKSDFSHTIDWPFENHFLKIMVGYDDYLRRFYGDYMQLPPIEKQISTHHYVAYWKSDEVA